MSSTEKIQLKMPVPSDVGTDIVVDKRKKNPGRPKKVVDRDNQILFFREFFPTLDGIVLNDNTITIDNRIINSADNIAKIFKKERIIKEFFHGIKFSDRLKGKHSVMNIIRALSKVLNYELKRFIITGGNINTSIDIL